MELAQWAQELKPRLRVEVINLTDQPDAGDGLIVAVPTYAYADSPIFLGNPSPQELRAWLDQLNPED